MKWRQRASRNVVEAVVSVFRDPAETSLRRLWEIRPHEWKQSYHWLDASGMALYFLDRIESLHFETVLPATTLARLRGNLADNRERSSAMFAEFTSLNQSFQEAGLLYANLKGFALSPESCPRPELRCQLDFDFLMDGAQLSLCRELLSKTGYELMAATPDAWEFKAGSSEMVSVKDHYKARPQRCVELHFASSVAPPHLPFRDRRLERLVSHSWAGL
ncbi:MAG TPA: nucleotidyltransferase family protein, partial [Acidobacteriaceae bacterium]|nr:nucleotidyltransferase family protein [Acidobacteriaceae bacterium]